MNPTYIFLDPDGSQSIGLTVIVAAPTGVTYAHQCAGIATEDRELEGFAVPLGDARAAEPLLLFFRRFKGNPPCMGSPFGNIWTDALITDRCISSMASYSGRHTGIPVPIAGCPLPSTWIGSVS